MSTQQEAPTFVPLGSGRHPLRALVPEDTFHITRLGLLGVYLCGYLYWLNYRGVPIDRISVAISIAIFLVCAFIGRSLRTWAVLLADCALYSVMWLAYERTRGAADDGIHVFGWFTIGPFPRQLDVMREIDRAMFLGNDPNVVLQDRLWQNQVRWWDWVASTTYMTHFVLPMAAMAVLWAVSHRQWARFIKRFATLLLVACVMFVLMPTVPPWMAGDPKYGYNVLPQLHHSAGRGFYDLGFRGFVKSYTKALGNGNPVAAMPSLHSSFALIVPLFFMQWIRRRWVKWVLLLFPVLMLASLVYLGEHWIIDGLVGWAITVSAFWFWDWHEARTRTRRVASSEAALA